MKYLLCIFSILVAVDTHIYTKHITNRFFFQLYDESKDDFHHENLHIGKGTKAYVSLPRDKGVKLSIAEERDKRLAAKGVN